MLLPLPEELLLNTDAVVAGKITHEFDANLGEITIDIRLRAKRLGFKD